MDSVIIYSLQTGRKPILWGLCMAGKQLRNHLQTSRIPRNSWDKTEATSTSLTGQDKTGETLDSDSARMPCSSRDHHTEDAARGPRVAVRASLLVPSLPAVTCLKSSSCSLG